jgi:flagellar biosynthetic protein FliR
MDVSSFFSVSTLLGFVLILLRIGGIFIFIPLPGLSSGAAPARIALIVGLSIALYPVWPHPDPAGFSAGTLALWTLSETAFGVGIGLLVAFITEAFQIGAQMIGLQAGFSFASTIDPSTQADSTVLGSLMQTVAALLIFATGLDREIIRAVSLSVSMVPPGSVVLSRTAAESVLTAGTAMFAVGLRLALPVIAALVLVDISLALLGRINAQLQLITIAFPVKIVLSLALLVWMVAVFPTVFRGLSDSVLQSARSLMTK